MSGLVVSANDAKLVRQDGRDHFPDAPPADTVTVLDASVMPPRVLHTVEVSTSIVGPPQSVAISPDGRWVVVGSATHVDAGTLVLDDSITVVDLQAGPAASTIDLGAHAQGIAFHPDGRLLLIAAANGEVLVCRVGDTFEVTDRIAVSAGRLAGLSFTHDGSAAIVALRDENGAAVLDVSGTEVTLSPQRISTGVSPYVVDVDAVGRWAVIGNVGWGGKGIRGGDSVADADSFTLVDVAQRPFRAVQHVAVPSIPEGVALSPEGAGWRRCAWPAASSLRERRGTNPTAGSSSSRCRTPASGRSPTCRPARLPRVWSSPTTDATSWRSSTPTSAWHCSRWPRGRCLTRGSASP